MSKYRIYRLVGRFEYKDVEAKTMEEAEKHYVDYRETFETLRSGYILNWWITADTSKLKKYDEILSNN